MDAFNLGEYGYASEIELTYTIKSGFVDKNAIIAKIATAIASVDQRKALYFIARSSNIAFMGRTKITAETSRAWLERLMSKVPVPQQPHVTEAYKFFVGPLFDSDKKMAVNICSRGTLVYMSCELLNHNYKFSYDGKEALVPVAEFARFWEKVFADNNITADGSNPRRKLKMIRADYGCMRAMIGYHIRCGRPTVLAGPLGYKSVDANHTVRVKDAIHPCVEIVPNPMR